MSDHNYHKIPNKKENLLNDAYILLKEKFPVTSLPTSPSSSGALCGPLPTASPSSPVTGPGLEPSTSQAIECGTSPDDEFFPDRQNNDMLVNVIPLTPPLSLEKFLLFISD